MNFQHDTFISPFTWRYGSPAMRQIWSETRKRQLMRRVWLALAEAQAAAGLVSAAQVAELRAAVDAVDIERALEIERETRHDVMAEIRTYAEQCPTAGGIIHLGATSADITDNVDVLRLREGGRLLQTQLAELLRLFADKVTAMADRPVMAYTHIQPAEPTTLGYRLATYAQDLYYDYVDLSRLLAELKGKGLKGAVGTQASYQELLQGRDLTPAAMEAAAMAALALPYFPIATQTYSRQQDIRVQNVLAGIAASLHKFAYDVRLLQSPHFGEWSEPFGARQVGSSAMPFKRNPINAENICSLARYVAAMPAVAWNNGSQAILERSLDDSANRRLFQAESFLAVDEMLRRALLVLRGMVFDEAAMGANLERYGPFAATERVLMALVQAGASRQDGHEWLRAASMRAWTEVKTGGANPLVELLVADEQVSQFLAPAVVRDLMHAAAHVGTAPARARAFADFLNGALEKAA